MSKEVEIFDEVIEKCVTNLKLTEDKYQIITTPNFKVFDFVTALKLKDKLTQIQIAMFLHQDTLIDIVIKVPVKVKSKKLLDLYKNINNLNYKNVDNIRFIVFDKEEDDLAIGARTAIKDLTDSDKIIKTMIDLRKIVDESFNELSYW